ncbi:MAG TPA: hypothetical protein VHY35_17330 [Stellaceae bacterium]|nr:hypothetical protein [Stellaceae bacterium]
MLSYEWRELEALCERIGELRDRYNIARRAQNYGLIQSLKDDVDQAQRQREQLVQHISARLGSAAAGPSAEPAIVEPAPSIRKQSGSRRVSAEHRASGHGSGHHGSTPRNSDRDRSAPLDRAATSSAGSHGMDQEPVADYERN